MGKRVIEIEPYFDGYAVNQINCIDLPIAGAAGAFDSNNYFYYCFYVSFMNNWKLTNSKHLNYIDRCNYILQKFGLQLEPCRINNSTHLISFIKESIDSSFPILLIMNYYTLYYSGKYQSDTRSHGTIVNGYDDSKSLLVLTDINAVDDKPIQQHLKVYPLYTMYMKESHLKDLWLETTEYYKSIGSPFTNIVYRMVRNNHHLNIENYSDLLSDILARGDNPLSNDKLIDFIDNYNNLLQSLTEDDMWAIRNEYVSSLDALFKCFEKILLELLIDQETTEAFLKFKGEFISHRSMVASVLIANKHRGKYLEEEKINSLKDGLILQNNQLVEFMMLFHRKKMNGEKLVNIAIDAKISADSEYFFDESHTYFASYAIDGQVLYDTENYWSSDFNSDIHWIVIDLCRLSVVRKYVIKHHFFPPLYTKDFKVLGSKDGVEWTELFNIINNNDPVTSLVGSNEKYRYYKILISKSNTLDNIARLYQIELWG